MTPPTPKQMASGCRHFTGLLNSVCTAGIPYKDMIRNSGCLPCLPPSTNACAKTCPFFEYKTVEEIERERQITEAAILMYSEKLSHSICPHCNEPIESQFQIGRCVYARPCGHRLYQGASE